MPRYRKWLKSFSFEDQDRVDVTLSGTTVQPQRHRLEIKPVGGVYPTSPGLLARTRVTTPSACRKWAGFFVLSETAKHRVTGAQVTDIRYRLNDGTIDRHWDEGSEAWVASAPDQWNTEQQIADHIASWPVQSLGVVINLRTTDALQTPYVTEVRLLFETDLIALEDYVVRSFVEELREKLRPISRYIVKSTGQTSIDLKVLQTPYDVESVDAIYNNEIDPNHMAPLTGWAYDADGKLLSIPAQPTGHELEVRFVWRPYVVLTQSQDYTEIARIPAVVVERVELLNTREIRARPYVLNKGSGQGFVFEEGQQSDIALPLRFVTASKYDLHALQEEAACVFANLKTLRARGQDDFYPIRLVAEYRDGGTASQKEIHSAGLQARILNAVFYPEDARPITGVLSFKVTGGPTIEVS